MAASFLAELLLSPLNLKTVQHQSDRSCPQLSLAGQDVLDDEAERWRYFFNAGASGWFPLIERHTFATTFVELSPAEASIIVEHWELRQRAASPATEWPELVRAASARLESVRARLDRAVAAECAHSEAGLCFVKLSTRSPKDSRRALARAEVEYRARLAAAGGAAALSANQRWRILSEEATRAVAVKDGAAALELVLDSERVFEDLEYALRGPPDAACALGSSKPPVGSFPRRRPVPRVPRKISGVQSEKSQSLDCNSSPQTSSCVQPLSSKS